MPKKISKLMREIDETERIVKEQITSRGNPYSFSGRLFREFRLDMFDFITMVAGIILIIVSIFGVAYPPLYPALFFGLALIITITINDWKYQAAVLAFTLMYWVGTFFLGLGFGALDFMLFIFGVNTISLGIFLAGSIAVASAGVLGFTQGVFESHRWAGGLLVIVTIILGLFDFFVGVYILALPAFDVLLLVLVNIGVYAICLTITYILFYYLAKFYNRTRKMFDSVAREEVK